MIVVLVHVYNIVNLREGLGNHSPNATGIEFPTWKLMGLFLFSLLFTAFACLAVLRLAVASQC